MEGTGGRSLENQAGFRKQRSSTATQRILDISSRQLGITGSFPGQQEYTEACGLERLLGWLWGGWMDWKGQVKDRGTDLEAIPGIQVRADG